MLQKLAQVAPSAAEPLAILAAKVNGSTNPTPPPREFLWEVCGELDKALKDLDGAIKQQGIVTLGEKHQARHLFTWLLTDKQSTTQLNTEQLGWLLEFITRSDGAEAARAAVIAAIDAGIVPQQSQEVSKDMEEHTGHKLNTGRSDAPEVAVRATVKVLDGNGFEWLFTISEGITGEVYKDFLGVLKYASDNLRQQGFIPCGGAPQRAASSAPQAPPPPQTPPAAANTPPPAAPRTPPTAPRTPPAAAAPQGNGGQSSFAATQLVGNVMNGKVYWSVQGGQFQRHGVRIWPEVLEQIGWDVSALDPTQPYDLTGYTAVYENDAQNHKKIVSLQI